MGVCVLRSALQCRLFPMGAQRDRPATPIQYNLLLSTPNPNPTSYSTPGAMMIALSLKNKAKMYPTGCEMRIRPMR